MSKMDQLASQLNTQGGGNSGSTFAKKVVLKSNEPNPIRILDMPDGVERMFVSWILCDDDKKRPFIIENTFEGKSLFAQMLGDREAFFKGGVLESEKDPVTGKGRYKHQNKNPELFTRILFNGDLSGSEGSWRPRETYQFNAIQRNPDIDKDSGEMVDWCKENKHCKLLEIGSQGFKSLQDVRLNDGSPSEYDINYLKKGSGKSIVHSVLKAGPNVPHVVIGGITEEENSYTRYALQKECALTPASVYLKNLRNSIEQIDVIMGTNWISKFEAAAAKEGDSDASATSPAESKPEESPATPPVRRGAPAPEETKAEATGDVEPCGYCKKMIPVNSIKCPECSQILMEPCVKCQANFSIFSTKCPSCGKDYKVG